LKKTRESIISQTYGDYEWIVIDGGSTDGTKEFLQEHADEMSYWCSEKDKGVYNAQNKGTSQASGDYCIYMNAGDTFYDKEVLEKVFSEVHEEDILYGDWAQVFPNGKKKYIEPGNSVDYAFFFVDNICHQAMFIKTSLLKESPYDETYRLYADWAKWTEFAYKGKTFKYIHQRICYFMMDGMSAENEENNEKERKRVIEECYPGSLKSMMLKWKEFTVIQNQLLRDSQIENQQNISRSQQAMKGIADEIEKLRKKNKKHLKQVRYLIYTNVVFAILLLTIVLYLCFL
jgi:glycosyltransferase involved in cell wall biosynthesis